MKEFDPVPESFTLRDAEIRKQAIEEYIDDDPDSEDLYIDELATVMLIIELLEDWADPDDECMSEEYFAKYTEESVRDDFPSFPYYDHIDWNAIADERATNSTVIEIPDAKGSTLTYYV